jgi:putative transposase
MPARRHIIREGKIERWHQTLKNRILLENYPLPGDLGTLIEALRQSIPTRHYFEQPA